MPNACAQIATFNCEWRRPASRDAKLIRQRVLESDVEVACLTETHERFFEDYGHSVTSAPFDTGIHPQSRRKVLLWSQRPWRNVRVAGPDCSPPGPHIAATTDTSIGELTFVGIIIPYRWAGVKSKPALAKTWELHLRFLTVLDHWLPSPLERTVILGDFNQRIPRKYQPVQVFDELDRVLLRRFKIATAGVVPTIGRQAIDHICHTDDLVSGPVMGISNLRADGGEISDHFGVRTTLSGADEDNGRG